jgi:uncharacterized repeat protein (TIGR01451 family)
MKIRHAFLAAALGAVATFALANAGTPRLEVQVRVEREVVRDDPSGRRVVHREPVGVATPGDTLVYTLEARNAGDGQAVGANLDDPIPEGTTLVVDSVDRAAAPVSASLDGAKSWVAFPATVERRAEDGTVTRVPAPAEAYTHLRWSLPGAIAPGESRNVSFKVRIR